MAKTHIDKRIKVTKCPVGYAYGYEGQALPSNLREGTDLDHAKVAVRNELEAFRFRTFVQPQLLK